MTSAAQENPLTGDAASAESYEGEAAPPRPASRSLFGSRPAFPRLNEVLREQQRLLNDRLAELIDSHSETPGSNSVLAHEGAGSWGLLGGIGLVAFVYGLVHAALPGHRKVLLVSYFMTTNAPLRHALFAGLSVAVLHAGAAAAVVLLAYYVLQVSLGAALSNATTYLQAVTSVFVLAFGLAVLVSTIREVLHHRRGYTNHRHHHDHYSADSAAKTVSARSRLSRFLRNRLGLLPAIVLSAVVPDAGSALILVFAISLDLVSLGLFAVVFFSLGMAMTQVTVLAAAVLSKRVVAGALDGRLGEIVHITLEGLGGLAMVAVGAVLLLSLV